MSTNLAQWSSKYKNSLPNSSYAWIDSKGGKHLPYKDADGKVDLNHVRNALARLDQVQGMPDDVKTRVKAMLQKHLGTTNMGNTYMVINGDAPVETIDLANGKQFVKQVVKYGNYAEPGNRERGRMILDTSWGQRVVENFKNKVVGRVPVPLGHPKSPDELALFNKGEVVALESRDDGLYATLDIRDAETAKKIEDDLIWDDSVSFDEDYVDSKHGKHFGPTLKHIGLLVDPYIDGMAPFQALSNGSKAIMLSKSEDNNMPATVVNNRDFAVTVKVGDKEYTVEPGEEVEVTDDATKALVEELIAKAEAPAPEPEPSPEPAPEPTPEPTPEPAPAEETVEQKLANAEKEAAALRIQLSQRDAEADFDKLLHEGKVIPAQKDTFLSLASVGSTTVNLSNGDTKSLSAMLTELLDKGPKRVDLSEKGHDGSEGDTTPWGELTDRQREVSEKMGITADKYNDVHSKKN